MNLIERMEQRSEWRGDCLVWTGYVDPKGYGRVHPDPDTRQVLVHRLSWLYHHGPIPPGLGVLHRCDNPPCWNPAHLWVGTNAENTADMIAKGRDRYQPRQQVCQRGHEMTPENTYVKPDGKRNCRRCRNGHRD